MKDNFKKFGLSTMVSPPLFAENEDVEVCLSTVFLIFIPDFDEEVKKNHKSRGEMGKEFAVKLSNLLKQNILKRRPSIGYIYII